MSVLVRLLIALVVIGVCAAVAWWAFRPAPAAQEENGAGVSAQSTTLPLF